MYPLMEGIVTGFSKFFAFLGSRAEQETKEVCSQVPVPPVSSKKKKQEPQRVRPLRPVHAGRSSPPLFVRRRRKGNDSEQDEGDLREARVNEIGIRTGKDIKNNILGLIHPFIPETYTSRQVQCINEILFWVWKYKAIGETYKQYSFLKKYMDGKKFGDDFRVCFKWLDSLGLVIRHKQGKTVSFNLKSEGKEQNIQNAIATAFHNLDQLLHRN